MLDQTAAPTLPAERGAVEGGHTIVSEHLSVANAWLQRAISEAASRSRDGRVRIAHRNWPNDGHGPISIAAQHFEPDDHGEFALPPGLAVAFLSVRVDAGWCIVVETIALPWSRPAPAVQSDDGSAVV